MTSPLYGAIFLAPSTRIFLRRSTMSSQISPRLRHSAAPFKLSASPRGIGKLGENEYLTNIVKSKKEYLNKNSVKSKKPDSEYHDDHEVVNEELFDALWSPDPDLEKKFPSMGDEVERLFSLYLESRREKKAEKANKHLSEDEGKEKNLNVKEKYYNFMIDSEDEHEGFMAILFDVFCSQDSGAAVEKIFPRLVHELRELFRRYLKARGVRKDL